MIINIIYNIENIILWWLIADESPMNLKKNVVLLSRPFNQALNRYFKIVTRV